jgi:hypothetical protein
MKTLAGLLAVSQAAFQAPEPTGNIHEIEYEDIVELKKKCGVDKRACARWYGLKLEDLCTIHYMRGDTVSRRHELRHCQDGNFHGKWYQRDGEPR